MSLTVTIPTFETERLILRAPRIEDAPFCRSFYNSDRSKYNGGPEQDATKINRAFCAVMGLWALRGYSLHIGALKTDPNTPIGSFGTYNPMHWPEPELGWSLWNGQHEGQGYATEAIRTLMTMSAPTRSCPISPSQTRVRFTSPKPSVQPLTPRPPKQPTRPARHFITPMGTTHMSTATGRSISYDRRRHPRR